MNFWRDLPDRTRWIYEDYWEKHLTHQQIATEYGITVERVKHIISIAERALRGQSPESPR